VSPGRVAVVGSTGFIGRAVVPALQRAGWEIDAFSRARPFPAAASRAALPDAVVHLASTVNPRIAERYPDQAAADLATLREVLASLAGRGARGVRFVLPSSGGTVYDPSTPPPYDESSPTAPLSAYGRTKLRMEEILHEAAREGTVRPVILRLSNVYGEGQPLGTGQGVIIHWLHAAATGQEAVLFGDPSATRDYVHLDDAAVAFCRALEAEDPPSVVNIGSGRATSLGDLADLVEEIVGTEFRVRREADRGFDVAHSYLVVRRAAEQLGWRPKVELRQGLALTWKGVSAPA
jgi:UDP-glucose 4-epimerase